MKDHTGRYIIFFFLILLLLWVLRYLLNNIPFLNVFMLCSKVITQLILPDKLEKSLFKKHFVEFLSRVAEKLNITINTILSSYEKFIPPVFSMS